MIAAAKTMASSRRSELTEWAVALLFYFAAVYLIFQFIGLAVMALVWLVIQILTITT